mgnify:CR=1 FL=1
MGSWGGMPITRVDQLGAWWRNVRDFGLCMLGVDDLPQAEPVPRPLNNPWIGPAVAATVLSKRQRYKAVKDLRPLWQPVAKRLAKRWGMKYAGKALIGTIPVVGWAAVAGITAYEAGKCVQKQL